MWRIDMTDDTKDNNNVKPIRKGVVIEEEKKEVNQSIVAEFKMLLELAESGDIQELCYVAVTFDDNVMSKVKGGGWNWAAMDSAIGFIHRQYQGGVVFPAMLDSLGYDLEDLGDE